VHRLQHLSISNFKKILKEHGIALLVIIIGWELIEDILFPVIFWQLGQHVNPAFFVGIPASLIICLHWLIVPIAWGMWIRLSGKEEKLDEHIRTHVCETEGHNNE
jgi:hypothetical protein